MIKSDGGEIWLVSDGRKTWEYISNLNEYTETAAAPLVEGLWAHPIRLISDDLARYRSLSHEAGHAKLRAEKTLTLGGHKVRCYVVAVPARAGSQTLWIDEKLFQNPVHGDEFKVVVFCEGWIAEVDSARGRADGAIRSVADRRPVGQDPALAPQTTATTAWRSTSVE